MASPTEVDAQVILKQINCEANAILAFWRVLAVLSLFLAGQN
jgi:hypothetical protein